MERETVLVLGRQNGKLRVGAKVSPHESAARIGNSKTRRERAKWKNRNELDFR